MTDELEIGPLLACAIGDAYGAGFEFVSNEEIRAHNDLTKYHQNPKWPGLKPGHYTDDTQMAMAVMEFMLEDRPWNTYELATQFVSGFHRDPRPGYANGFYQFLQKTTTGGAFLAGIQPHSDKSGGAMRAFPIGALPTAQEVRDRAMFQASLTHATWDGMTAAAAAALAFHHRYHNLGPKDELQEWVSDWTHYDFTRVWWGSTGHRGLCIVHAALDSLLTQDSLMGVIHSCVGWGGDVDTVAAIAAPIASVCMDTRLDISPALLTGLENSSYGQDYIRDLDRKFLEAFPKKGFKEAPASVYPVDRQTAMDQDAIADLFGDL